MEKDGVGWIDTAVEQAIYIYKAINLKKHSLTKDLNVRYSFSRILLAEQAEYLNTQKRFSGCYWK